MQILNHFIVKFVPQHLDIKGYLILIWKLFMKIWNHLIANYVCCHLDISWDFSRFKYLGRFQLDCFNSKKWFDGHIQLRIAAVGQSPSGLWYTCVHAKQLLIDPMCICEWKKKYSLFLRQCMYINQHKVKRKERSKKKKKKS